MLLTTGRGKGVSESVSMQYEALVRPEEFTQLVPGEAFVMSNNGVFKVKIPEVVLRKDDEGITFPRFRMASKMGLNVSEHTRSSAGKKAAHAAANPPEGDFHAPEGSPLASNS
jgi:hypothetical protein